MLDYFKGTMIKNDWIFVGVSILSLILLCAGFYFFVYQRQGNKLAQLDKDIATAKTSLMVANRIKEGSADFEVEFEKAEKLVKSFELRLPDKSEIPLLVGIFQDLAEEAGVVVSLDSENEMIDPNKITIPYKVTATGTFHEIVTFINKLEREARFLKVSNIDIKEEEDFESVATFTLSTYRFRQAAATGETT